MYVHRVCTCTCTVKHSNMVTQSQLRQHTDIHVLVAGSSWYVPALRWSWLRRPSPGACSGAAASRICHSSDSGHPNSLEGDSCREKMIHTTIILTLLATT